MIYTIESIQALMNKGPVALDGVPEALYHKIPAMSNSGMKEFMKGPGYWRHRQGRPSKDTAARKFFRLVHMCIGEYDRFVKTVVAIDGSRNSIAVKEAIARSEAAGKVVLPSEDIRLAIEIRKACLAHPLVSAILQDGVAERSFFWIDPKTKAPCKARLDWVTPSGCIVDWKSFNDVWDDDALEYQVRKNKYDYQAVWYSEAYFQVYKKKPIQFYNCFLSDGDDCPNDLAMVEICDFSLEDVNPIIKSALIRFAECLKKDEWPLTPPIVKVVTVKKYKE